MNHQILRTTRGSSLLQPRFTERQPAGTPLKIIPPESVADEC